MKSEHVVSLGQNAVTERTWNFRDDNNRRFFGCIPLEQRQITLRLNWKPTANTVAKEVGRYRINLPGLEESGYVHTTEKGRILRFQRTGDSIEIAINWSSPALPVGRKP